MIEPLSLSTPSLGRLTILNIVNSVWSGSIPDRNTGCSICSVTDNTCHAATGTSFTPSISISTSAEDALVNSLSDALKEKLSYNAESEVLS